MSSDSSSHASRSDAVSLTHEPSAGFAPTTGPTVVKQHTTEFLPSSPVSLKASITRHAPETSMVPKLSDVLSDLRELHFPLSDTTPRGVPKPQPSPSNLHLTARALCALRRDITRTARESSLPSLTTVPLTTVPQRTTQPRQELPAKCLTWTV